MVAADFSLGMLGAATRRDGVDLVGADGLALPFADGAFDAATMSFGLRNVADTVACLRELRRVVKPGGRLVICEFSRPVWAPFRTVYVEYLMRALPAAARAVSSNPDAYVYLAESIRAWPDQAELAGADAAGRVGGRRLAQSDRWHRRAAPRLKGCSEGWSRRCQQATTCTTSRSRQLR